MSEEYSIGYSEGYQAGWNEAMDASPPAAKRQFVGLTNEEIFSVLGNLQREYNGPPTEDSRVVFALAIEAKLREKNGGGA